jgi:hypothetical protein
MGGTKLKIETVNYTLFDSKGRERYISIVDIQEYDFSSIEEYTNYINESFLNGNKNQCRELINDMCITQILEMLDNKDVELLPFVVTECKTAIARKMIGVRRVQDENIKLKAELDQAEQTIKSLEYSGPIRKKS